MAAGFRKSELFNLVHLSTFQNIHTFFVQNHYFRYIREKYKKLPNASFKSVGARSFTNFCGCRKQPFKNAASFIKSLMQENL